MSLSVRRRLGAVLSEMPPTYWLLWVGTLINRLGGFVAPFLSLYLTGERGIPVVQATLVISLFGAGSFVGRIVGGELSDRIGRRPVMLASFLISPAVILAVGLARDLSALAVFTFLLGFFTDIYRPAVSAAIADLVPPARRIRAFGYLYWAINLGAAIAPAVGGFMARDGYFLLFAVDAATTFVFGLIVLFRFSESQPEELRSSGRTTAVGPGRLTLLFRQPLILLLAALALIFGAVYAQSSSTLPVAMSTHGIEASGYGIVISLNGLLIVLLGIPVARNAERWNRFGAIAVANLLLGVGFGFARFADTVLLYAVSVVVWTLGEILNASIAPAVVADLATPEVQGLYQGVYGSAWGLAFFIGPAIGGWIFGRFGQPVLWTVCFVAGLAGALGYFVLGGHVRRTAGEKKDSGQLGTS